jgi:hypothetical protein
VKTRTAMTAAIAVAMMAAATLFAADQPAPRSEPIYGYRMMNDQERNEYRDRMRNARGADARQAIRDEHRKLMEARAKERGVTLPEPRGPRGPGAGGPGAGKGPGYGPQGKGPGYGPEGKGPGYGPQGKGPGYGPGAGKGPGYGPEGKGPGYGKGPGPGGQQ